MMKYKEVLEYLFQLERMGIKLGLETTNKILAYIGDPHKSYPTIHIAGTNGKGSTAAIIESILSNSGYRVGLYTSPHLVDFRERIRISGRYISRKYVADFFNDVREKFQLFNPTFFEATTALAFSYFRDEKVDLAIIETGMGGRFDSTNILKPLASVITNIEKEHTRHLGTDLDKIAFEKAGIIKNGVPVVTAIKNYEALRVIRQICRKRKAKLVSIFDETQWVIKEATERKTELDIFTRSAKYYNLRLSLPGHHQLENAVCGLVAAEYGEPIGIKVTPTGAALGFRNLNWPGRLQRLSKQPEVILDVGHNPAAIKTLFEYFKEFYPDRHIIAVFGILSDKDSNLMLIELNRFAKVIIITKPITDKAADTEILARQASHLTSNFQIIPHVDKAYEAALNHAKPDGVVLVTGSHYTVGEVLSYTGYFED
ncbi:MAG: bifunctional folylpolyglutamate synthase/dihydrofolate synthase [candidate division Zixibacteria bacterium]|nr:bifunctional folylpolyglutamate synthase/dihydrofolate synthase [candidate division Zixibacteria bacterium]